MKTLLGILAFALVVPLDSMAQSPELAVGARVRVTSPRHYLNRDITTVTELRGDSMVVTGKMGTRTIALSNVTALDVSTGTRNNVGRYALIGLGAGALLGVTAGATAKDDCEDDLGFCPVPVSGGQFAAASALIGGALGVVTGAITGSLHRTERWEKYPGVRASIAPSASGGVTLRVSRAF